MLIDDQIKNNIKKAIPNAQIEVVGNGRHFNITVISSEFEGKKPLAKQQLVYSAIASLMAGPDAPVHAVDSLKTLIPSS